MSDLKVSEFRLTAIWVETNTGLCERPDAPLKFLCSYGDYAARFKEAQYHVEHRTPASLSTPWQNPRGQHFWTYYTRGSSNVQVSSRLAWQRLIPFRTQITAVFEPAAAAYQPVWEFYFYPFGVACLVSLTVRLAEPFPPDTVALLATTLRHQRRMPFSWPAAPEAPFENVTFPAIPDGGMTLNQLGRAGLDVARQLAMGDGAPVGRQTNIDPFTICTILEGAGEDSGDPPADDGPEHQALQALTTWQGIRPVPTPIEAARIPLGQFSLDGDILYGLPRARALWYPSRFTRLEEDQRFVLGCFHRNLTFATLQTESLGGFVAEVARRLTAGPNLSTAEQDWAKRSAGILGMLYGGHPDTYRSRSLPRQMDDNRWTDPINRVRNHWGMGPLH